MMDLPPPATTSAAATRNALASARDAGVTRIDYL
jgi:hypothetical protein